MKRLFRLAPLLLVIGTLAACGSTSTSTTNQNARTTETNQQRLQNAYPAPLLPNSLERQNLIDRLERINAQNMSGCIYLLNNQGILAMYPVAGKVTSLNSYLTPEAVDTWVTGGGGAYTTQMPDLDGAYGENVDGVFFFTADTDAYVEWVGPYMFSDQCLAMASQPMLVRDITTN